MEFETLKTLLLQMGERDFDWNNTLQSYEGKVGDALKGLKHVLSSDEARIVVLAGCASSVYDYMQAVVGRKNGVKVRITEPYDALEKCLISSNLDKYNARLVIGALANLANSIEE